MCPYALQVHYRYRHRYIQTYAHKAKAKSLQLDGHADPVKHFGTCTLIDHTIKFAWRRAVPCPLGMV